MTKTKQNNIVVFAIILTVILAIILVACNPSTTENTISIMVNGKVIAQYNSDDIVLSQLLSDLQKDGYICKLYVDAEMTIPFNASSISITEPKILYAEYVDVCVLKVFARGNVVFEENIEMNEVYKFENMLKALEKTGYICKVYYDNKFSNQLTETEKTITTSLDLYANYEVDPSYVSPASDFEMDIINDVGTIMGYKGSSEVVVIPENLSVTKGGTTRNVTKIADQAFARNSNIHHVKISSKITSVGKNVLTNCDNLETVVWGSSIETIEEYSFSGCTALEKFTLPKAVKTIKTNAFNDCYKLKDVYYGGSLTDWCSVTLSNAQSNPMYLTKVFYADNTPIVGQLTLPSVSTIKPYAFYGYDNFTDLVIPESVTSIGTSAFENNMGLATVHYQSNLGKWCDISFSNITSNPMNNDILLYVKNGSNDVAVSGETTIPDGQTSISKYAFAGYKHMTSITLPSSLKSCGVDSFLGVSKFESVKYLSDISNWCKIQFADPEANPVSESKDLRVLETAENTDSWMSIAGDITLPDTVTSINPYCFNGIVKLKSLTLPSALATIGNYAFYGCRSLININLPNALTSIENYAFYGCYRIETISFPDTLTTIGNYAFSQCNGIKSINFSKSLLTIGDHAFAGCTQIGKIEFVDGSKLTTIGAYAFELCKNMTEITLPTTLKDIGIGAFKSCSSLQSISIPSGVTSIKDMTFEDCSSLVEVSIPNTVTSIGHRAFMLCTNLKELTMPDSVTTIGQSSFAGCKNMTTLSLSTKLTAIADNAFVNCNSLEKIIIPNAVATIGYRAFSQCYSVTAITLGSGLKTIGEEAFTDCRGITKVTIPSAVTTIGANSFKGCTSLVSVVFSDTTTWYVPGVSDPINVSNETNNVTLLTQTYVGKTWTKS